MQMHVCEEVDLMAHLEPADSVNWQKHTQTKPLHYAAIEST